MDDLALVDHMLEHKIGIEANLTSNWHTNTVASYAQHPLKTWLNQGLLATINTDDPGISPVTLREEFEVAAPAAGLTPADTRQAQLNALEIAFLPVKDKEVLLRNKSLAK
ncbi:MAG: adenosine deaminase, partial [Brevefilum sp.]|nr:adenosine deaminase [Brevefilum sp.]